MKKLLMSFAIVALSLSGLFGATSAVFEETVKVAGTSFSVATSFEGGGVAPDSNTALKMLKDLAVGTDSLNLSDSVPGQSFENIEPTWVGVSTVKMYNQGDIPLDLITSAEYVSDLNTLRDDINIEISAWNDDNSNGILDAGEEGDSYGYDTILRMKNDTFPIGTIGAGETKGFVLRFDGAGLTDSNKGSSAVYDFTFTGVGQ